MNKFEFLFKSDSKKDTFLIRPFFDLHVGTKSCDLDQLRKDIDFVKKRKNCYWYLGGDMIDAINVSDKRADFKTFDNRSMKGLNNLIYEQVEEVYNLFKPIQDRLMWVQDGNHETAVANRYYIDATTILAQKFKAPNLNYMAYVRLAFLNNKGGGDRKGASVIKLLSHHGYGSGRRTPAKLNAVMQMSTIAEADIYVMGHNHGWASTIEESFDLSRSRTLRLKKKDKLYVLAGTYMKTYTEGFSSYGERAGYSPTRIGSPVIVIKPEHSFRDKINSNNSQSMAIYYVDNSVNPCEVE